MTPVEAGVQRRFSQMLLECSRWAGRPIRAKLLTGPADRFPERRNYAMCYYPIDGVSVILVAPRFWETSRQQREALLRHELGHAVDFQIGSEATDRKLGRRCRGREDRADWVAQAVWGKPLRYDRREVQTLRRGTTRPNHLPNPKSRS